MPDQVNWDFAGDDDARAEIVAAVSYLLRDATGNARSDMVQEIIELVRNAATDADASDTVVVKRPLMSGVTYKDYVIDPFQRDTDRWRATIRRLDGKKIRVAVPLSVVGETTTSADALTAEKAVGFAKREIDSGGLV